MSSTINLADLQQAVTAAVQGLLAPQLYRPNEAAAALGLSRAKVYELMKRGQLAFVVIDSDRRIPASEVRRLVAEGVPGKEA
ncbi:helix-turn-helix domain-containing protein [Pseudomonas sp. SP16.1]|uniref:helix-turn-helix domain-containing protein n=1 Tax=Pseudomonas sp. SP16.1 TaxID=3458854 RepID=UPI004046478D